MKGEQDCVAALAEAAIVLAPLLLESVQQPRVEVVLDRLDRTRLVVEERNGGQQQSGPTEAPLPRLQP